MYYNKLIVFLGFLSVLAVSPQLLSHGTNIVTKTYQLASERVSASESPFQATTKDTDVYKYSPFFAFAYAPFAHLPSAAQAWLWALLNVVVFWLGVYLWVSSDQSRSFWVAWALALSAVELNISLLYQQVNALLVGMVLIGIHFFKERRFTHSGAIFALAVNFKLIPILFVLPLFFERNKKYIISFLLSSVVLALFPSLFVGVATSTEWHFEWAKVLVSDMGSPGIYDLQSFFSVVGFPALGKGFRFLVLGVTIAVMFQQALKRERKEWFSWISVGLACLLLVSPRTESPTFVLIAPVYYFLTRLCLSLPDKWRKAGMAWVMVWGLLVSVSYTDLWPFNFDVSFGVPHASKTVGTFALWLLATAILSFQARSRRLLPNG